ncbi:S8 family serine peptidase [Candidatus Woesearchaeota archaeon]|nr:S8 family serine peptidase [Candidatus Woesearchaeota archaeon]
MIKRVLFYIISAFLLFSASNVTWVLASERPLYVPGEILVKFKGNAFPEATVAFRNEFRLEMIKRFNRIRVEHLRIPADLSLKEIIEKLRAHPMVEYAEPNYLRYLDATPNDTRYPEMWGLHNYGQTGGIPDADVDAPEAWDIATGNPDFVVADIDSGMDMSHPDLAANVWTNPDEIPGNGIDDDGNGYIDDVHGWDFAWDDNDPSDTDIACAGHGTHTAGTIGAQGNNGIGVTGINWDVKIMPLKAFKTLLLIFCSAADSDIISAINYAADKGVKISNNSYGGGPYNQAVHDAIKASRSLFVAASGNGGLDAVGDDNDVTPHYPSSYNLLNILSVAATDHNDVLASFSNYGMTSVDLGAPGVSILSTTPNNNYSFFNGTSMATPHVTGAAALLWDHDPTLTVNEVKWRLLKGADQKGLPVLSRGRLNVNNSLNLPPPLVTVDLSPVGSTSVPKGGTISYNIVLTNQSGTSQDVIAAIGVQLPDGTEVILNGPVTINMEVGSIVSKTFSLSVPLGVPDGEYSFFGRALVVSQSFDEDMIGYVIY